MKIVEHHNDWPWGHTITLVTEDGGGIVELSFEDTQPGVAYLSGLSVAFEFRRKGYSKVLLDYAEKVCELKNIFRIDLSSSTEQFVLDMYHSRGFVDIKMDSEFMKMYKFVQRN